MQVYDYDWGLRDDFMGQGQVCLSSEQVGGGAVSTLVTLVEAGARARESLGRVSLATTLAPLPPGRLCCLPSILIHAVSISSFIAYFTLN